LTSRDHKGGAVSEQRRLDSGFRRNDEELTMIHEFLRFKGIVGRDKKKKNVHIADLAGR